jgi:hypothetical protein
MKNNSLLLLLLLAVGTFYAQTYTTGVVNLSSTAGLAMTAKLDLGSNVTLTLTGPSTRWFALGFNASSMAAGTDVVGVHSAGALTAFDANLTGYNAPATDAQQNWTITSDQVAGGVRTVIATRALSTGDPNDYSFTAAAGTLSLIWARANSNSFNYAYHGGSNRGITTATLTLVPATPPPTGSANQTFCAGATVSQLVAVGSNIQWYANASGGSPLAGGTPLVNGTTYHASQTIGGLESQNRLPVTINLLNIPAAPTFVNPVTSFCATPGTVTFTVNPIPGAVTYSWLITPGLSGNSQTTSATLVVDPSANSESITVAAVNQCGQGPGTTLNLNFWPSYNDVSTVTVCDSLQWNGQWLMNSGVYVQQGSSVNGCDSSQTLQLTVLSGSTTDYEVTQCIPFTLNGITYNQTGMYQQILTSALGCDSVLVIDFTLDPSFNLTFDTTVTGSFEWNNQTYTQSGTYTQNMFTVNGCDSTVTVNLTVMTGSLEEGDAPIMIPSLVQRGSEITLPEGTWNLWDFNGRLMVAVNPSTHRLRMDVVSGIYLLRSTGKAVKILVIE